MNLRRLPLQTNSRVKTNLRQASGGKFQGVNGDLLKKLLIKSFSKARERSGAEIMNNSEKPFNSIAKVLRSLVNYLDCSGDSSFIAFAFQKSIRTEYRPAGNQTSKKLDFHQRGQIGFEQSELRWKFSHYRLSFALRKVAAEGNVTRCDFASIGSHRNLICALLVEKLWLLKLKSAASWSFLFTRGICIARAEVSNYEAFLDYRQTSIGRKVFVICI